MNMYRETLIAVASAAAIVSPVAAAYRLGDRTPFLMEEAEEIALSRSAGPDAVSADANVLVMQADGRYRMAVEGSNGWTCFTGRAWTGPAPVVEGRREWTEAHFAANIRAPQCFNEAAASVLQMHLMSSRMFMQGADSDEVDAAIGHALGAGEITVPGAGAMSYMLSPQQVLRPNGARFMPHLMLYTPYATPATYGGRDEKVQLPMVTDAGSVWATTVVVIPTWSDGSPAGSM